MWPHEPSLSPLGRVAGSLTSEAPLATWPGGGPCAGSLRVRASSQLPACQAPFSPDPSGTVNHAAVAWSYSQLSLSLASLHPLKGSLWSLLPLIPALASAGREARADVWCRLGVKRWSDSRRRETLSLATEADCPGQQWGSQGDWARGPGPPTRPPSSEQKSRAQCRAA